MYIECPFLKWIKCQIFIKSELQTFRVLFDTVKFQLDTVKTLVVHKAQNILPIQQGSSRVAFQMRCSFTTSFQNQISGIHLQRDPKSLLLLFIYCNEVWRVCVVANNEVPSSVLYLAFLSSPAYASKLYLGFHSTLFMAARHGIWCTVRPVWTLACLVVSGQIWGANLILRRST